jgi:cobalt/nickel transport system permease protein
VGEQSFIRGGHRHGRGDFIERLLRGLLEAMEHAADAERLSAAPGLLQRMDPRIKILGLLSLIVTAVFVKSLLALGALFAVALGLALWSQVSLARLGGQVWLGVLLFTGVLAAPAPFLVPGEVVARLPLLNWTITWQGLRSAAFLIGRAETAATFALLVILTTPWPHVLKALRSVGVPVVVIAILGMTHRYIFLLLSSAVQMFEAHRSRLMGPLKGSERRRLTAASAVVLLDKALRLSSEVHLAMIARGYRGEVHLVDDFRTRSSDWIALTGFLMVAAAAVGLQWLLTGRLPGWP